MQSKITVIRMKAVSKSGFKPVSSEDVAVVNAHPGVSEWFSENWEEILTTIAEGVSAALLNPALAALAKGSAERLAKTVANGSDAQKMAKAEMKVRPGSDYDQIRVIYRAWSEDDLKRKACKVIHAPPHVRVEEVQNTRMYVARCIVNPQDLPVGRHAFIFGAQDDGWHYDVAVTNELDLIVQPAA